MPKLFAPTLIAGILLLFSTQSLATAVTYNFRVASKGLVSPLKNVALGDFSVPGKSVGDAPFVLVAPLSESSGLITYTSSNPAVATVSGAVVTIIGEGNTTITAVQAAAAAYSSATTSDTLVVSPAGFIVAAGLTWAKPDTEQRTYANSVSYCHSKVVNGVAGWRLSTLTELSALHDNWGAAGYGAKGWPVVYGPYNTEAIYWSSTPQPNNPGKREGKSFANWTNYGLPEVNTYFVACVHE